jgi:hypothetical protein
MQTGDFKKAFLVPDPIDGNAGALPYSGVDFIFVADISTNDSASLSFTVGTNFRSPFKEQPETEDYEDGEQPLGRGIEIVDDVLI